jgi:hypothetical protein
MSRIKNFIRNLNYLTKRSLWDQREQDIVYLSDKILDDVSYEYDLPCADIQKLMILDKNQTMNLIESTGKSFIRTGDGEVNLMKGSDHPFLKYNSEVAKILIDTLEHPKANLYVGVNRNYFVPLAPMGGENYYRRHAYDFRKFYMAHCDKKATYIDATCTSLGIENTKEEQQAHFDRWRHLFADRDIVVVCGEGILDKLEYDIFELARSKEFVYGPRTDAWDKRDELMSRITSISKDKLIVFILGQSGKAMIVQLADMGYTCWDVGHLAKYYNAFMTGMEWNAENTAKFYAPD